MFDWIVDLVFLSLGEVVIKIMPLGEKTKEKVRLYGGLVFVVVIGLGMLVIIWAL